MNLRRAIRYLFPSLVLLAAFGLAAQQPAAPPVNQPPAAQAGRGGRGAAGGGRGPTFPQQTRQLASPDVIARGKAVFGVNCSACHGADLRGGDLGGPNLLRSQVALSDQHGELIAPIVHGARQDKGMPAFNLTNDDTTAVAEYIHSVLAKVGNQARPPGSEIIPELQVVVGNPAAGKAYFDSKCSSCHSVSGDLAAYGTKYAADPRALQNTWVSGSAAGGRGGFGPAADDPNAKPVTVTVTMPTGEKIQGRLLQRNEFEVTLEQADGARRTIARNGSVPKVEVQDPADAHRKMASTLDDTDMHNVTAYLASVK